MKIRTLCLIALTFTLPAATLSAQDSQPTQQIVQDDVPTLQEAGALLQAGDVAGAIAAYRSLAAAEPTNAQAHHMVGYCLHMAGQLDAALKAHLVAAEFPAVRATALYNCACVHAMLGRSDAAFEFLARSREAGFNNADQLAVDSDMDNLRGDARFSAILTDMRGGADGVVDLGAMQAVRRFDFWSGQWETVIDGLVYGSATVTRNFGGRGFQQNAMAPDGNLRSTSQYTFSAANGTWKQIWMDGESSHAVLVGGLFGNQMIMTMVSVDGTAQVSGRSIFSNISSGSFEYEWQSSADGGQTWQAGTQVTFRKAQN